MKKVFTFILFTLVIGLIPLQGEVQSYTIPTFSIQDVTRDVEVVITTYNFPANHNFVVRMGLFGTAGIGGIIVGTVNSGAGGSLVFTFSIPAELQGQSLIAIRMDATTDGYYAYNWFYNTTVGDTNDEAPFGETTPVNAYYGIPTISILSVNADQDVTIQAYNFPAGYDFEILMGKMWTQGIGGVYVATLSSGSGGAFAQTFSIPASLAGESQISIRLESTMGGFYAYNWFYNNTTP